MTDVDGLEGGVTALWEAVVFRSPENARALAAAGADRVSIGGWSPGRLSLAGPTPDLFPVPAGMRLTATERAAAREADRLIAALGELYYDGTGLACVAGIDAAEAVRRLEAVPVADEVIDELLEDPYAYDMDESLRFTGVTSVPGGCVVTQPWGYAPQMPGVLTRLSDLQMCGSSCRGSDSSSHCPGSSGPRLPQVTDPAPPERVHRVPRRCSLGSVVKCHAHIRSDARVTAAS
ncbi:hypothetical protein ACFT8P_33615 [Streptomyces sp. NPDC057101]|uniref:hypothetical protein n=1 Tax=Streptomyces sp. NPDC057101 TaxID=3346020 RepID=UPI003635FF2E